MPRKLLKFNGGLRYASTNLSKMKIIKTCPGCGQNIEGKLRQELDEGNLVYKIVFECPCGFFGVGEPRF